MPSILATTLAELRLGHPELFAALTARESCSHERILGALMRMTSYPLMKVTHLYAEGRGPRDPDDWATASQFATEKALADFTLWMTSRAYDKPNDPWPNRKSTDDTAAEFAALSAAVLAAEDRAAQAIEDAELTALVDNAASEQTYKGWGTW